MNALSLYSGIGGMDLGAHLAGIETVGFCEQDSFCRTILERHWPGVPIWESDEDVTAESVRFVFGGRIDLIFGGPPCQPFSVAGKQGGVADPRHRWPQMARIVAELRPSWVVVENVAGFGDVAERIVRPDLASCGYDTVRLDVPAAGVGAPHKRERIFVVAYAGHDGLRVRGESHDGDGRDAQRDVADGCDPSGAVVNADERGRGIERLASGQADGGAIAERADHEIAGAVGDTGRRSVQRLADGGGVPDAEGARTREGVQRKRRRDSARNAGEARGVRGPLVGIARELGLSVERCEDCGRDGLERWIIDDYSTCSDEVGLRGAIERRRGELGAVADADGAGRGKRRRAEPVGAELGPAERRGGEAVADTSRDGGRIEPAEAGAERERTRVRGESGRVGDAGEQRRERGVGRPRGDTRAPDADGRLSESGLGRISDGLADWLDATRWPAPRGCAQYDWEPPRVTEEKEFRRKRLKALGNAVVPQQVAPLFAIIRALHEIEEGVA